MKINTKETAELSIFFILAALAIASAVHLIGQGPGEVLFGPVSVALLFAGWYACKLWRVYQAFVIHPWVPNIHELLLVNKCLLPNRNIEALEQKLIVVYREAVTRRNKSSREADNTLVLIGEIWENLTASIKGISESDKAEKARRMSVCKCFFDALLSLDNPTYHANLVKANATVIGQPASSRYKGIIALMYAYRWDELQSGFLGRGFENFWDLVADTVEVSYPDVSTMFPLKDDFFAITVKSKKL